MEAASPRAAELAEVLRAATANDNVVQHVWIWSGDAEMCIAVFCAGSSVQLAIERCWIAFQRVLDGSSVLRDWELAEIHVLPVRNLNFPDPGRRVTR
jgi:hypothetical protein